MADEAPGKPQLLVVDDESELRNVLAKYFSYNQFEVRTAADAVQARAMVAELAPDVVLVDVNMPGESGLSLARKWRADARTKTVPIIMLTARGDESDRVAGLDAGADDYIAKPFSTKEMLARIRAVLRRRAPEQAGGTVSIGALVLDASTYRVTFQGQPLKMGPTEFKLLHYLMQHAERVHSRSQLLDRVWGDHVFIEERTVDVHVKRLREALGGGGTMIETVRGAGYRITAQAQPAATLAPSSAAA